MQFQQGAKIIAQLL